MLKQVCYTSNEDLLCPHTVWEKDGKKGIDFSKIGKYKNLSWEFQKEWRYCFRIFPIDITVGAEEQLYLMDQISDEIISGSIEQKFPYFDMILDDEAFNDMSITLSPCISAGYRTIVEDLVEKYNPAATLQDSSLLGTM